VIPSVEHRKNTNNEKIWAPINNYNSDFTTFHNSTHPTETINHSNARLGVGSKQPQQTKKGGGKGTMADASANRAGRNMARGQQAASLQTG